MSTTIVAPATPHGESALAVVRLSGPHAQAILGALFAPGSGGMLPRRMAVGALITSSGDPIDRCCALWMPGPHTYTGEDTVEFYPHGNPFIVSEIVERCVALGARIADPGEFTRRAFMSGKLDLAQAEAVMDLIAARTRAERDAALRRYQGVAARSVAQIQEALADILVEVEAELNYPEEDLPYIDPEALRERVAACAQRLEHACASADIRERRRQGVRIALTGEVNAGKSSLFNALVGIDRVMVSQTPGTTRDVVEYEAHIGDLRVILCDTAGFRPTEDPLEIESQRRAQAVSSSSDILIHVHDARRPLPALSEDDSPRTILALNKCDLLDRWPECTPASCAFSVVAVSALTGQGIEELRGGIAALYPASDEEEWLSGERAVASTRAALATLRRAKGAWDGRTLDLLAEDLREAWHKLGEVTGHAVDEAIIDRVFERFCLGK